MAEIPVDLTGIVAGQTVIWDGAKLVPAPRMAGSAPRTAATIDELGPGNFDVEEAIIRVGTTYPDIHDEYLVWSAAASRWVGQERVLVTQSDTWSMSLGNRSAAQMLDWSPFDINVPYGAAFGILTSALDLDDTDFNSGDGVIVLDATNSPHSFPFSDASGGNSGTGALLRCRDNYLSHVGKTSTDLQNVTWLQGSRGVIPAGEKVWQGYPGGWSISSVFMTFVSNLIAAGLSLQEQMMSLCNNGVAASDVEKILNIAPYWYQYDPGDATANPTIPPTGGLGVSTTLNPVSDSGGPLIGNERTFYMTTNGWVDWPLPAPSKKFLVPRICGKMSAATVLSGEILDTRLAVRWVSEEM